MFFIIVIPVTTISNTYLVSFTKIDMCYYASFKQTEHNPAVSSLFKM